MSLIDDVKLSKTTKDKNCIECCNFVYQHKRTNLKDVYWVCRHEKCNASLNTIELKVSKVKGLKTVYDEQLIIDSHNHAPLKEEELISRRFIEKLKSKAEKETTSMNQLFQEIQGEFVSQSDIATVANHFPQYEEIKSGLYNIRRKNFPKLPPTINDISLTDDWTKCQSGGRFLLNHIKDDANGHLIIFCSDTGLEVLAAASRWHSDGTFTITPTGFKQVYLIHAYYKEAMIPCVYALLTRKTTRIYKRLIHEIKNAALKLKLVLNPSLIITDFESAAILAYDYHFPDVNDYHFPDGCFFHFSQSVYRNIVNHGLKNQYNTDENLKKWEKSLTALALVPEDKVGDVYCGLVENAPDYDCLHGDDGFLDYFTKTYIEHDETHSGKLELYLINQSICSFFLKHTSQYFFGIIITMKAKDQTMTLRDTI